MRNLRENEIDVVCGAENIAGCPSDVGVWCDIGYENNRLNVNGSDVMFPVSRLCIKQKFITPALKQKLTEISNNASVFAMNCNYVGTVKSITSSEKS